MDASPIEHIALPDASRPQQIGLGHHTHAEPRHVELVVGHHAGMFGGLATQQGTARASASLGDPFHQGGHPLGHDPAHREVVQEEERFGARAHHVVGTHRHQVDAHRVQTTGCPSDLELRAHPVGGRGQEAVTPDPEEPCEPAHVVGHLGTPCPGRKVADQRDGFGRGFDVHAGVTVGLAHRPAITWAAGVDPPARTCPPARGSRSGTRRRSMPGRTGPCRPRRLPPCHRARGSRGSRRRRRRRSPPR